MNDSICWIYNLSIKFHFESFPCSVHLSQLVSFLHIYPKVPRKNILHTFCLQSPGFFKEWLWVLDLLVMTQFVGFLLHFLARSAFNSLFNLTRLCMLILLEHSRLQVSSLKVCFMYCYSLFALNFICFLWKESNFFHLRRICFL